VDSLIFSHANLLTLDDFFFIFWLLTIINCKHREVNNCKLMYFRCNIHLHLHTLKRESINYNLENVHKY
jgi:hypothetical protein